MTSSLYQASVRCLRSSATLEDALAALRISLNHANRHQPYLQQRYASHQAQGRANKAHQGPGKRLGAKKTGGQYVVPGNILYKQRGTLWFPGENTHMGRDHTIHASVPGYVRYYRDPMKDKRRKYIGVVLDKEDQLPHSPYAPRRRQLGMLAYEMKEPAEATSLDRLKDAATKANTHTISRSERKRLLPRPTLRPGYQWRVGNWQLGREGVRMGYTNLKPHNRNKKWLHFQETNKRKKVAAIKLMAMVSKTPAGRSAKNSPAVKTRNKARKAKN